MISFWGCRARREAAQILLFVAIWLASHPYLGIVHDARLYLVQALHAIDPVPFAGDLYFAYGSQNSFTIFSILYRPAVKAFGPALAHGLFAYAGQAIWLAALIYLTRRMFSGSAAVLAAIGVILLNPYYGSGQLFSYGEPFATPRIFAEASVMLALALYVEGRSILALGCAFAGCAIHPLMALPGIAVLALLMAARDRRLWLVYSIAPVPVLILAAGQIEPFHRLFLTFDAAWFETVWQRCSFAFPSRWDWHAIVTIVPPAAVLFIARQLASPDEWRLYRVIGVVALTGCAIAFVSGDLGRNVLFVNLQLWRGLWLLCLFGNAWTLVLVQRLPSESLAREFLIFSFAIGVAEQWVGQIPLGSACLYALSFVASLLECRNKKVISGAIRIALRACASIIITMTALLGFYVLLHRTEFVSIVTICDSWHHYRHRYFYNNMVLTTGTREHGVGRYFSAGC